VATTITDILNIWNNMGVFSYVIPFLLIFAVIYAILDKTKMFSGDSENRGIIAIIAVSISLLSLQFDFVSNFFAIIFPRFGVGLSLFLVALIFLGFFFSPKEGESWGKNVSWIGWVIGIGVIIWALSAWGGYYGYYGGYYGFGWWFDYYLWEFVILGIIIAAIYFVVKRPTVAG